MYSMETSYIRWQKNFIHKKKKVHSAVMQDVHRWAFGKNCSSTNDGVDRYGIPSRTKAWIKMHAQISHKTKGNILIWMISERKIKATFNQFVCLWLRSSQFWIQGSSCKGWKYSNKHTFFSSLAKSKRHLGPVKMIKSITPYKQCEVWGGYNSICWNWENTLINRKKLYVLCMYCIFAPLCTYWCVLGS